MKWKERIEGKIGLIFSNLVNVVVLFVSLLALFIGVRSLEVSIDSLNSAEKSGSDQQKVLEASRKSLEAVVYKLNIQTQIQFKQYSASMKSASDQQKVLEASRKSLEAVVSKLNIQTEMQFMQYKETLRSPKVRAYFGNFLGGKLQLFPSELIFDEKTETANGRGPTTSSPIPIAIKKQADGRALFYVMIENVGNRELVQADISVSCIVPFETYPLGETVPPDPDHPGYHTINFAKKLLSPFKESQDAAVYNFSTKGPFPFPDGSFGCFVEVNAPGLTKFVSGGFLRAVDK